MYLSDLTWLQAKQKLNADTLVLIPLGAAAKEHGPHLRLDNDCVLADYLTARVEEQADVVVAPTLPIRDQRHCGWKQRVTWSSIS